MLSKERLDGLESHGWTVLYLLRATPTCPAHGDRSWRTLVEIVAIEEAMTKTRDEAQRDVITGSRESLIEQDALVGRDVDIAEPMENEKRRRASFHIRERIGLAYKIGTSRDGRTEQQ